MLRQISQIRYPLESRWMMCEYHCTKAVLADQDGNEGKRKRSLEEKRAKGSLGTPEDDK